MAVSVAEQQVYIDEESKVIDKKYKDNKSELAKLNSEITMNCRLLDKKNTEIQTLPATIVNLQ